MNDLFQWCHRKQVFFQPGGRGGNRGCRNWSCGNRGCGHWRCRLCGFCPWCGRRRPPGKADAPLADAWLMQSRSQGASQSLWLSWYTRHCPSFNEPKWPKWTKYDKVWQSPSVHAQMSINPWNHSEISNVTKEVSFLCLKHSKLTSGPTSRRGLQRLYRLSPDSRHTLHGSCKRASRIINTTHGTGNLEILLDKLRLHQHAGHWVHGWKISAPAWCPGYNIAPQLHTGLTSRVWPLPTSGLQWSHQIFCHLLSFKPCTLPSRVRSTKLTPRLSSWLLPRFCQGANANQNLWILWNTSKKKGLGMLGHLHSSTNIFGKLSAQPGGASSKDC